MTNARIFPNTVVAMHYDRDERTTVTVDQRAEGNVLGHLNINVDGETLLRFIGSTAQVVHVREELLKALAALEPLFVMAAQS